VPRLDDQAATLGQELDRVRAYLDLMQMRIPDRLQFALDVDPAVVSLRCPPMTLLTLVENAVRHGIDPSEEGGSIDIRARREGGRCKLRVTDTGVGLRASAGNLGTGLAALRERLQLLNGGDVTLVLRELRPRGVCVEVDFPAAQ
jgi:sensor histidine kinase YesM